MSQPSKQQQLSNEIVNTLRTSQQQLVTVKAQIQQLERQDRIAQLTKQELNSYDNKNVWRSCGRAFVLQKKESYIEDLSKDESTVKEQIKALNIKKDYLETTIEKSVDGLKKLTAAS
ncbi:hypothetical protein TBLA_0J01120 [Henningerozyma blattae CBS 6284]|uniref:Prefoldin subunit 1 n=1 Tax=Henningerozyma blattae (strain ATCC 34711 / CBS 6284 / DSM 70876 / NBRC 10599 / NRRL Y-10934 / UCD 77-7) TaxID=1071380 RepID=I2H9Q8_HENB6|nr:hypothetical protein TBLA_0J01120 [Tetrapisispora blattae CBS 6284]CCH63110.1 hypothetical protein TBLA_0J01120 [Tetrapisispora blattae CBS 6284]